MKMLGERLRARRKEKGVTQAWVAARLPVDRTTYTKYETGQAEPSLENLCRLARMLDCTVGELLGENE